MFVLNRIISQLICCKAGSGTFHNPTILNHGNNNENLTFANFRNKYDFKCNWNGNERQIHFYKVNMSEFISCLRPCVPSPNRFNSLEELHKHSGIVYNEMERDAWMIFYLWVRNMYVCLYMESMKNIGSTEWILGWTNDCMDGWIPG